MLLSLPSLLDHFYNFSHVLFDLQAEEQRTGMRMDYGKAQSCSHSDYCLCFWVVEQDNFFTPALLSLSLWFPG